MKITAQVDRAVVDAENPGTLHTMVRVDAPRVDAARRTPIDVCLVIDVSGSMNDLAVMHAGGRTKMNLVQHAAAAFIENLDASDRAGLVTFSTHAAVRCPVAELTPTHRDLLTRAIAHLRSDGGTDLCGGAMEGFTCLGAAPAAGDRTKRIILFTDGMANAGLRDADAIASAVQSRYADLARTVSLSAFGFGSTGAYAPELLQKIASVTDGNYVHCEGEDGILEAFADELGALRSVAASDVRVTVTPAEGVRIARLWNPLPHHPDGTGITVEAGSLYSDGSEYIVLALELPTPCAPGMVKLLRGSVRGITADGLIETPFTLDVLAGAAREALVLPNPAVEEQRLRLEVAERITEASALADAGQHQRAAEVLDAIRARLVALGTAECQRYAEIVGALARDIGDRAVYAERAMHVKSASTSFSGGAGKSGGSRYTKHAFTTEAQHEARATMGAKDAAHDDLVGRVGGRPRAAAGSAEIPTGSRKRKPKTPW